MKSTIIPIGNSRGIRIPKAFLKLCHIQKDVDIDIKGDTIIDGGILSPLPIRTLQHAGVNKIIAVNVFPTKKDIWERHILMEEAAEKEARLIREKNLFVRGFFKLKKAFVFGSTPSRMKSR